MTKIFGIITSFEIKTVLIFSSSVIKQLDYSDKELKGSNTISLYSLCDNILNQPLIDFYKYEKDLINGQLNEENKYNINIE